MKYATVEQIQQLRLHAVNDVTRPIMADGILLTDDQVGDLGDETIGWMVGRLGLNLRHLDNGLECSPPKHYGSVEDMRDGIEIGGES